MTKLHTLTITVTAAVIGLAAFAAPSQAATRLMSSSLEGFEYRCETHGGIFAHDGTVVDCQTPSVPVSCEYFAGRQATCNWPGIENQIDVIRVIGTLPVGAGSESSSGNGGGGAVGSGGKGGGNFQGPKDVKDAPNNNPKPNFDGPNNIQMAP